MHLTRPIVAQLHARKSVKICQLFYFSCFIFIFLEEGGNWGFYTVRPRSVFKENVTR